MRERSGLWPLWGLAALLLITRSDMLVLIGPSLCLATYLVRAELKSARTWLALLPLVLWEAFSTFYYGFPFPITAYA